MCKHYCNMMPQWAYYPVFNDLLAPFHLSVIWCIEARTKINLTHVGGLNEYVPNWNSTSYNQQKVSKSTSPAAAWTKPELIKTYHINSINLDVFISANPLIFDCLLFKSCHFTTCCITQHQRRRPFTSPLHPWHSRPPMKRKRRIFCLCWTKRQYNMHSVLNIRLTYSSFSFATDY